MFADLHVLAQSATLLIVVSAEGDDLRVSVTPTQADSKKAHVLRPLSLLATPAELDTDFAAALVAWQAPRKSLVEQAQAAAGADDEEEEEDTARTKPAGANTAKAAPKGKPGPKKKDAAPAPAAKTGEKIEEVAPPADKQGAPEFELQPPPVEAPGTDGETKPADAPPVPAPEPVVDTKTLDLF